MNREKIYQPKIIVDSGEIYDKLTEFLEINSIEETYDGKYHYYKLKNRQARADKREQTIELTDKVDGDIKDTLHIFSKKRETNL